MTPTFQRKHYEMLAKVIRALPEPRQVAEAFIPRLTQDNPNFKPERFLRACTIIDLTKDD